MSTSLHALDTLTVGDLVFTIATPTDRTTMEITVERDASLVLRVPADAAKERVARFVESKLSWVYRKLAEKDALVGPPVVKQFTDGEGFAYLGRSHRLKITPGVDSVRLDRGRFLMSPETATRGSEAMRRWYTSTGQPWLRRRAQPWTNRLAINDVNVEVLDLGYRWGSAGNRGINVHWATLQLPPSLIDYVLVHELAHLHHRNHTADFWSTVGLAMPGYATRKEALRHVGKNAWLGNTITPDPEPR